MNSINRWKFLLRSDKMQSDNHISRRRFLGASALAMSTIGTQEVNSYEKSVEAVDSISSSKRLRMSPREASVLTMTRYKLDGRSKKVMVEQMLNRLNDLSYYNPDIICLPEAFAGKEPEFVNMFENFAKEHKCYVICPLHSSKNGKAYNSAVLIDRQGNIIGQYDKIHPTESECNKGITPGPLYPPVFKTDFGVIGIQICYDVNWIDTWRRLKEKGAEIVFWPSAYPGGRMLTGLAWLFKYYVVTSTRPNPAIIVDMSGDIISESGRFEGHAFATLNLEKILCEVDYNSKKVPAIHRKYGDKVKIKFFHYEDWLTIESRSPDLMIQQLIDEFDLITNWDYIKRAGKYQEKFR